MGLITGHSYVQITCLVCSDDFKEMNEMQKPALWHSELELMPSTEIYVYIWVKSLFVLCPQRNNSYTYRQAVGAGSRVLLSWVGEKTKKQPLVEVRENVSILVLCIIYFCLMSNKPLLVLFIDYFAENKL